MTLVSSITNLALPVIFNITSLNTFGPISTVLMFGFTAYAIVKHHLLDIKLVIKKSFVFSILVVVAAGVYAISVIFLGQYINAYVGGRSEILVGVFAAILIVLFYEPFKKFLENITDSFLFKGDYHSHAFLAEISSELSSTLDVDALVDSVSDSLDTVMRVRNYVIFLREPEGDDFFVMRAKGWNRNEWKQKRLIQSIAHIFHQCSEYVDIEHTVDQMEESENLKQSVKTDYNVQSLQIFSQLSKREVLYMFPMCVKEKVIGFLVLGEKKSGDLYREKDLNTLSSLTSQAALSFENAQLYQRMHQFNIHLKHEVEMATQKLQRQNKELKRLDKAKSEFVSIASHQLRTPLTSIKGYVSMILDGDFGKVAESVHEPLKRVAISTDRLVSLVEDLLNLSRIESGRLEYTFKNIDLRDLVQTVCNDMDQHAKEKGLSLKCDIPKEKIPVHADATKLLQVFQNLVDNAVKYTNVGSIHVTLHVKSHKAVVKIVDTGVGIRQEDIERIFQKFVRGKEMSLLYTGGSGIGLYIAKKILKEHKGVISAESKGVGAGSTFTVTIPLTPEKK